MLMQVMKYSKHINSTYPSSSEQPTVLTTFVHEHKLKTQATKSHTSSKHPSSSYLCPLRVSFYTVPWLTKGDQST